MTQEEALAILKTGGNVFLTGEPGSGKTYTINRYAAYLSEHGIEPSITASTGIAATHLGGYTVHSWSGIGVRRNLNPYDLDHIAGNKRVYGRVAGARVLVIDEVSMLSAQTLSMVEAVCREIRRDARPFGGLQVVLVGDFFQLPPVSARETEAGQGQERFVSLNSSRAEFAFRSPAWQKANPLPCYLSEQHRQEDSAFLDFLSAVRRGQVHEKHRTLLRTRYAKAAQAGITQLYSHNADVDHINIAELSKLPGSPRAFVMTAYGPDPLVLSLKHGCLSPETLSLKVGARVMFTKNDPERRFVNGTTGAVRGFAAAGGSPVVKTTGGREVIAEPMEWNLADGGRVLARIMQVPLRLAWAITVHKSQGMSLDCAHMNLSDCFEYGQGYVALSRVRTLSGLSLAGLNPRALEVHPEIREQDERFRSVSEATCRRFGALERGTVENMHAHFITACGGSIEPVVRRQAKSGYGKKEKFSTYDETRRLLARKLSLSEMAKERRMTVGTIMNHLEELVAKKAIEPKQELAHFERDPKRFAEMEKAFAVVREKTGALRLSPARELLDDSYTYDELRLARLFLSGQ